LPAKYEIALRSLGWSIAGAAASRSLIGHVRNSPGFIKS